MKSAVVDGAHGRLLTGNAAVSMTIASGIETVAYAKERQEKMACLAAKDGRPLLVVERVNTAARERLGGLGLELLSNALTLPSSERA